MSPLGKVMSVIVPFECVAERQWCEEGAIARQHRRQLLERACVSFSVQADQSLHLLEGLLHGERAVAHQLVPNGVDELEVLFVLCQVGWRCLCRVPSLCNSCTHCCSQRSQRHLP